MVKDMTLKLRHKNISYQVLAEILPATLLLSNRGRVPIPLGSNCSLYRVRLYCSLCAYTFRFEL